MWNVSSHIHTSHFLFEAGDSQLLPPILYVLLTLCTYCKHYAGIIRLYFLYYRVPMYFPRGGFVRKGLTYLTFMLSVSYCNVFLDGNSDIRIVIDIPWHWHLNTLRQCNVRWNAYKRVDAVYIHILNMIVRRQSQRYLRFLHFNNRSE